MNEARENRFIEAMAKKLSEIIESDYKEFKELFPNGKEPEWIIFITDKYAPDKDIQEA